MTHLIAATLWLCLTVTPPSGIAVIAKQMGFVNVRELDPDLMVDLKYSSNDNFMKMDVYGDLKECYLERSVAERLKRAHTNLHSIINDLSLSPVSYTHLTLPTILRV